MSKNIEQTKTGRDESVVMVCKSCGEQAERIKIAISIASKKSSEVFKTYSVSTDISSEELFSSILKV